MVAGVFAELAREQPRRRFTDRHRRRRLRDQRRLRPVVRHRVPRYGPGDLLRAGFGRNGQREQEHDQDPGVRRGSARPGVLRLRLEEVGVADRVAPALRTGSHSGPLPGDRSQFRWLPSVPVPREGRRARSGRPWRDAAAELSAAFCKGLGGAAAAGPGTDTGQADHALHRRRRPDRARGRAGRPHQHRAADLFLRDLRRAAPRTGHRQDQGIGGEDVRQPRRRCAGQGTGRGGRRRGRVAPDRRARRWSPPSANRCRRCPSQRRSSSAP